MIISRFQLAVAILLVLIAVGGLWLWQRNSYSKEILKLEIIVPAEAAMGEEIEYVVKYKNNGDVRLENPALIFEHPSGAVVKGGEEARVTRELEDIYPGQERTFSFFSRLFGKEGELKEAKALLQYTPRNLSARFDSETSSATLIRSVPLTFELDLPSRIESEQEFSFNLNYFSNSSYPLSNLRIKIEYPEGFTFESASPSPIGESEWDLGLLNRAEGGRIAITGSLKGEVQEAKIFKATLGMWNEGVFTELKEAARGIEITRPLLLISQEVNGSLQQAVNPGDVLHYVISFKNVSERTLENLFLVASLEGRPYDLTSVKPGAGTFQQGDNSIVFEAKNVSKLRFLGKGEEGKVEFWVNVAEEWETFSPQDKDFQVSSRVILSDVTEEFLLKVNSKLKVTQEARSISEDLYEITWEAQNLYNDVENAKVKAQLPQGVSFTGNIVPEAVPVTFDQVSREVVWEIGDMGAGTGSFEDSPSVSFQVNVVGGMPQLIGETVITGDDLFTERSLSQSVAPLSTTDIGQ